MAKNSHPYEDTVKPGSVAEAGMQRLSLVQLQITGPHVHSITVPLHSLSLSLHPPVQGPTPTHSLQGGDMGVAELIPC